MSDKIGFIGGGALAEAVISGIADKLTESEIFSFPIISKFGAMN